MARFYAVPQWQLLPPEPQTASLPKEELHPEDQVAWGPQWVDVLKRSEFRGDPAEELVNRMLEHQEMAVFARPPNDLPALLRTADQLTRLAKQDAGERAHVWQCNCGRRYAVPVALLRPVSIRCERCGNTVDLSPGTEVSEEALQDEQVSRVNIGREKLADFFREAMARGWPVVVAR